jgi:hypothetical protein
VEVNPVRDLRLRLSGSVESRAVTSHGPDPQIVDMENATDEQRAASYLPRELGLETLPQAYLRVRGKARGQYNLGLLATTDEGISGWDYTQETETFHVTWGRPRLSLQKAYISREEANWSALLGDYAVGFGQNLTFDETSRFKADGFYADSQVNVSLDFPGNGDYDIQVPQRMRGGVFTWRGFTGGLAQYDITAFFSQRDYNLYQYSFNTPNRLAEEDSVDVFLGDFELRNVTLPDIYNEQIIGAHANFKLDRQNYVGLTAFTSRIDPSVELTFDGLIPNRHRFGAVGMDFGTTLWMVRLNGEATLLDNQSLAAYLRSVFSVGPGEFLVSFRHYDTDYDNPHSGGFADADTEERDRDRDETGVYFKAAYRFIRPLLVRASYDQWYRPSIDVWRRSASLRLDYTIPRKVNIAFLSNLSDKDTAAKGRGRDYYNDTNVEQVLDDEGEVVEEIDASGDGMRIKFGGEVATNRLKKGGAALLYRRTYTDAAYAYYLNGTCSNHFQIGQDLSARARYSPRKGLTFTARARYLDEDVYGYRDDRAFQAYAQWAQKFKFGSLSLRYSYTRDLPDPAQDITSLCAESDYVPTESDDALEPTHAILASFSMKF